MVREGQSQPEQEPQLSYSATRFSLRDVRLSKQVYGELQKIVRTEPVELSAYRFMMPMELHPKPWIVVVLGEIPQAGELYERIAFLLSQGEPVLSLPDPAVQELMRRRAEETRKREYTEKHYKYEIKKKDKPKSKKKNRDPRHRGRNR